MGLKRGDVVTVALTGDLGKPRPAIIVETDRLSPTDHVLLCPGTSHVRADVEQRRVLVEPSADNGLREATQFQIDKLTVARRTRCGAVIGRLDDAAMAQITGLLIVVLGITD